MHYTIYLKQRGQINSYTLFIRQGQDPETAIKKRLYKEEKLVGFHLAN